MLQDGKNRYGDDSFWDISEEIVSAKSVKKSSTASFDAPYAPAHVDTDPAEINLPSKEKDSGKIYDSGTITRFVSNIPKKQNSERKLLFEYHPKNPLIKSIEVYTDNNADSIFATDNLFLRERRALLDRHGKEVPYTPFYSMMPRYSQMTKPQLLYYLWWRENIRQGVCLECDVSYAMLYAHELIASEDEDKSDVLFKLCRLYSCSYKGKNISYFGLGDIICDFCILYNLPLPEEYLGDKLPEFMAYCKLPEFFIDISDRKNPNMHRKVMLAASVYNYKKSKHYPGNEDIFEKHISGVLKKIFEDDKSYAVLSAFAMKSCNSQGDGVDNSYGNVLSSQKPFFKIPGLTEKQAKIKISYFPLSFLQSSITDALRYAENKIRDHLGIKSKLNVTTINPDIRNAIDEYASEFCPAMSHERQTALAEKKTVNIYDRFYDVPKKELSLENALDIEKQSWETTKILVETFSEENEESAQTMSAQANEAFDKTVKDLPVQANEVSQTASDSSSELDAFRTILGKDFPFLELCLHGDIISQRKFASQSLCTLEELCDRINDASLGIIGDILIEESDDGYRVIDDYKNLFYGDFA